MQRRSRRVRSSHSGAAWMRGLLYSPACEPSAARCPTASGSACACRLRVLLPFQWIVNAIIRDFLESRTGGECPGEDVRVARTGLE